jgi:LysM repeat protein
MNKEEPYRNQAERLKQRIEKINEQTTEVQEKLPPREQIHRQKKKKTKWKLKYPVIRLLVLFFILLPIIIFSVNSYIDGKNLGGPEKTSGNSTGYETINFEKSNPEDNDADKTDEEEDKGLGNTGGDDALTKGNDINTQVEQAELPDSTIETPNLNEETNTEQGSDKISGTQTEAVIPAAIQPQASADSGKIVYHTVQVKETLFSLAMKYYDSKAGEETIKKANKLKNENIYVGQVLKIPLDK